MIPTRISRRGFLRTTSCVSAALVAGRCFATAESVREFRLNYILASPMYGTTPLAEVLPEVHKIGARAIDIWPRRHANHREQVEEMGHDRFLALLEEHRVQLGMVTRFDLGPLGLTDELPIVKKFGGRVIVTGAGRGSGDSVKERMRSFVESMKPHVEKAGSLGITLAIENHGHSLLDSPDSLRYFAEFARSPHLGVALAPYHLPQDEGLLASLIEDLEDNLALFYAWQHGKGCMNAQPKQDEMLQMPGRGTLDFTPLVAALKKINYTGWTEIFMHPFPRGIPILDTTEKVTAAINESRAYLEECLKQV